MKALCPLCGLPAEAITLTWGLPITLIGCPCARNHAYMVNLPLVPMTDNHDPGDEDPIR